jgi:5'(3')-deoxyribonucleotidase
MIIGLDIDGVLADFNTTFIQRIIDVTGKDLFPPWPFDIPVWHYPQHFGYTEEELDFVNGPVWKSVKEDAGFWFSLKAYPGAPEFLSRLDPEFHDFYFLTQRAGVAAKAQTESWLEYHHYGLKSNQFAFPTVLLTADKGACAKALKLDLYIDDKDENCLAVNHESPKTRCIMMARSWNHAHTGIARVHDLKDFELFIDTP